MSETKAPKPSLGVVTTKTSRTIHRASIRGFLEEHAVYLFSTFRVVATGRTSEFVLGLCDELHLLGKLSQENTDMIRESLVKYPANSEGIVTVTHDLIEGRLPAVFHLSHYTDINTTFSSSVLRRQAAVHNVVYADSVEGCSSIVKSWRKHPEFLAQLKCAATTNHVDMTRFTPTQTNLALIAHDGKKLDMCLFFTQNLARILSHDRILATGTTGTWLKKFAKANWPLMCPDIADTIDKLVDEKFILCESGPKGGDVQIAHAALSGHCNKVIFFIDPMEPHPHEPDIKFFEQAIESSETMSVHIATNSESARYLLRG